MKCSKVQCLQMSFLKGVLHLRDCPTMSAVAAAAAAAASSSTVYRAAAAAVYRRFLRQIRGPHPDNPDAKFRHRVGQCIHEEVRREFSIPVPTPVPSQPASRRRTVVEASSGGDDEAAAVAAAEAAVETVRARSLARSLLALTWLKRAAADPLSGEGELLYSLMGQRDSLQRRHKYEVVRPKARKR